MIADYEQLFEQVDNTLSWEAKQQLQAEVIFLTHNEQLHQVNMSWHSQGEDLLWRPELQEEKVSQTGGKNVRYKSGLKRNLVESFSALLAKRLPYCNIRYVF